jgi:spore coat protein H
MKQTRRSGWLAVLLALSVAAAGGCTPDAEVSQPQEQGARSAVPPAGEYAPKLQENRLVYEKDQPGSVVHLYITVTEDNLTAERPMTWAELNRIANEADSTAERKLNVIVQEGTDQGPQKGMFGYGTQEPNASITLRGKSSIRAPQKSYKIKLFDNAGYWRDQRTINLNKHASDFTRLRNKLSFDYFKQLPDITSLRTQFVHLHVRDLTSGRAQAPFEDYGLYTQIEQPNKSFLRTHGLDPYGHLYKASNFEFFRYPDKLKTADDPAYDKQAFESVLEINGSNDHAKLLRMLDDVNDMSQDFDDVFDRHFDRDNFLTWMAANILMDNVDTSTQNFFLYSPLNAEKWYFLPWDYDGAFGYYGGPGGDPRERSLWQRGIQNYWGSVVANRFFKNPQNVEQLVAKVRELRAIINPENTRRMIETYKPVVSAYVRREPDIRYLPGRVDLYEQELERISHLPVENEQAFIASLQAPMPYFLGDVEQANGALTFRWGMSYDLQGDELTYRFQLAKEPSFARPLVDRDGLKGTSLVLNGIGKGHYFWRVTVKDAKGHIMTAFDNFFDENGSVYHGVRDFYVN